MVTIDAIGVAPGEYTLKFESFDANNDVQSTLKTDTIQVVVTEVVPDQTLAIFTEDIELVSILSGEKSQWTLPDIDPGTNAPSEVRFEADLLISEHLEYNSDSNVVSYDGEVIETLTTMKFVEIQITLVNSFGDSL